MLSSGTNAVRKSVKDMVQQWNNWTGKTADQHEARLPQTTSTIAYRQPAGNIEAKYNKRYLLPGLRPSEVKNHGPAKPLNTVVGEDMPLPAKPHGAHVGDYESSYADRRADTVHRQSKKETERIAQFGNEDNKCQYISSINNNKHIAHSRSVHSIPEHVLGTDPDLKSRSLKNIAYLTSDKSRDSTLHAETYSNTNDMSLRTKIPRESRTDVTAWETVSSGKVGDATPNMTVKSQQNTHGIIGTSGQCPGNKIRCDSDFADGDISTARKWFPSSESEREKAMLSTSRSSINTCSSTSSRSTFTGTTGISHGEKLRTRARSSNTKGKGNVAQRLRSKSMENGLDYKGARYQSDEEHMDVFEECVQTADYRGTDHRSSSSGAVSDMSSMELDRQMHSRSLQRGHIAASAPDLCRPTGDTHVNVESCNSMYVNSVISVGSSASGMNQSQLSIASTDKQQRKANIEVDTRNILEMHTDLQISDTRRLRAAKRQLAKTGLLLIVGEEGDGTTRMAYDIMASSNKRPFLVGSTSDYQCCIENEEGAIIFADDVFGKTSFEKPRYDKWLRLMDRIMSNVDKRNIQIIMVIKSNIVQDCEDFLNEHQEAVFKFSGSNNRLTVDEMKNIFRQILTVSESLKITICDSEKDENIQSSRAQRRKFIAESTIDEIARVALPSGYPKAVTRFISTRDNLSKGVTYFSHPDKDLCSLIDSWRSSTLRSDQQKYLALQCAFVHAGTVDLNGLDYLSNLLTSSGGQRYVYKKKLKKLAGCSTYQKENPTKCANEPPLLCNILLTTAKKMQCVHSLIVDIRSGVNSLNGVYLKSVGHQYRIAADCIEHAIALSCGKIFPKEIIEHCNKLFLCSHIGPDRTFSDDRFIPVRIGDKATCYALANRIQCEIMQGNVESMARHIAMREPLFVKFFFDHLKMEKNLTWTVLCQVDRHSQRTFVSHALDCLLFENRRGYPRNLAEWILTHETWNKKRKTYNKAKQIEREVLEHCCKAGLAENYFNLVQKLPIPVTTDCLFNAVETGTFAIVEDLVEIRPSPFEYFQLCRALQLACLKYSKKQDKERMALVSYLANHSSIDYKVKDLESIIHLAGRTGKLCLMIIVHKFNGDMDLVNSDSLTCLHLAAINKHAGVTAFAIDKGASQTKGDRDNQLPIHKAAQFNNVSVAQELVIRDRDILTMADSNGQQALHIAAKHNRVTTTRFLIDKGANKDAVDNFQQTPLHLAAQSSYAEVLHFLVHAGANLQMKDKNGHSPLQVACISSNSKAIKRLLNEMDQIETNTSECLQILVDNDDEKSLKVFSNGFGDNCMSTYGTALLHHAIKRQSPLVKALIDMGADVTQRLNELAPVHVAAKQGDVDLLKLLYDNGADVTEETSTTKDTVLHIAASGGHVKFITVILSEYNDGMVEARNKQGETALHLAARLAHVGICDVLLGNGASTSAMTKAWKTPANLAEECMASEGWNSQRRSEYETVLQMLSNKRFTPIAHLVSTV